MLSDTNYSYVVVLNDSSAADITVRPKRIIASPSRSPGSAVTRMQYGVFSIDKPFMSPALYSRYRGSTGYDYSGCQKGKAFTVDDGTTHGFHRFLVYPVNATAIDISLITAGAMNRLILFPIIASRWTGWASNRRVTSSPIIFVLHIKEDEEQSLRERLLSEEYAVLCQSRITLLVYVSSNNSYFYSNYPINILRNIGIRHCRTTHFLLVDTDMLVSQNTYAVLSQLKDTLLADEKNALVLPAIFSASWTLPDLPLEEQLKEWGLLGRVRRRMAKQAPFSAADLDKCMSKRRCSAMKNGLFTHVDS